MKKITKKEINERINELSKASGNKVIYKDFIKYYENDKYEIIAVFITISKNGLVEKYYLFNDKIDNKIVFDSYLLIEDFQSNSIN